MSHLIACHDCDLLHRLPEMPRRGVAQCVRCGAVIYRHKPDSIERTLALALAGMILYAVSNGFPLLAFQLQGEATFTTLGTGVRYLYAEGMWPLAALVFVTCILAPLLELSVLLYVFLPLRLKRVPWHLAGVFHFLRMLAPWSMIEVFMLGILVSVVKLAKMATIVPGVAVWAFALLIVVLAATRTVMDPDLVWERVRMQR